MRLLVVSHSSVLGAYQAKLDALAGLGWEVHLAAPAWWPEAGPRRPLEAPFPRVACHPLPAALHGQVGRFIYFGLGPLARRLRPDVVLAEEEYMAPAALQAARAARACGARFGFYTWENLRSRYKRPWEWVARGVLAASDFALAGGDEALALLRARGFSRPALVLPQYGVDPRAFRPAARRPRRAFTAGYLGRLVPEKGVGDLLRAFALLRPGARLELAGHGPLDGLARGRAGVTLRGNLAYADVPEFLRGLDCLVLPSRTTPAWKEQFGRVLAEAQACGVPCVGSDSGAIPSVIGDAGLVFPEGDAEALARALARLRRDRALAARLGRRGRARALHLFTHQALAVRLDRFVRGL